MIDASPVGQLISDSKGRCVYTNKAYQRLSGLTAAQCAQEHWSIVIHPEDREHVLSAWQGSAPDQARFSQEARLLRPDGGVSWVRLHIATLSDGGPVNIGHAHTIEDITARKEAKHALHAAGEALLEQNEHARSRSIPSVTPY